MYDIELNKNEIAILIAASNIFPGLVTSGESLSKDEAINYVNRSLFIAEAMAANIKKNRGADTVALGGDDPGPFPW